MSADARVSSWATIALGVVAGLVLACGDGGDGGDGSAHEIVNMGCDANSECSGGRCVQGLPGGLCTRNCSSHGDCPEGTVCADTESATGVCLLSCTSSQECANEVGPGYVCDSETDIHGEDEVLVCID